MKNNVLLAVTLLFTLMFLNSCKQEPLEVMNTQVSSASEGNTTESSDLFVPLLPIKIGDKAKSDFREKTWLPRYHKSTGIVRNHEIFEKLRWDITYDIEEGRVKTKQGVVKIKTSRSDVDLEVKPFCTYSYGNGKAKSVVTVKITKVNADKTGSVSVGDYLIFLAKDGRASGSDKVGSNMALVTQALLEEDILIASINLEVDLRNRDFCLVVEEFDRLNPDADVSKLRTVEDGWTTVKGTNNNIW